MKNLLFLSWRDIKHNKMGGAEVFTHEMLKKLDTNKYTITHISPMSLNKDGEQNLNDEIIDGIHYLRKGNMLTVILYAMIYYMSHAAHIDYVIDQVNTHRFFTPFWVKQSKRVFFIHQLTREIWSINMKFPWDIIGKYSENLMTQIYKNNIAITVSNSTKQDLLALGFNESNVYILPEGINFVPWEVKDFKSSKQRMFTYVGRISSYKGIDVALEAYCKLYHYYPDTIFNVVGKGKEDYIKTVLEPIRRKYNVPLDNINYCGFVSEEEKLEIMSKSHCLVFPSRREGWGLTITEAAAVGTPSIVYKSPGLIDAVDYGKAGYLAKENNKFEIFKLMKKSLTDNDTYRKTRKSAYEYSKLFNWNNTAAAFSKVF